MARIFYREWFIDRVAATTLRVMVIYIQDRVADGLDPCSSCEQVNAGGFSANLQLPSLMLMVIIRAFKEIMENFPLLNS